MTCILLTEDLPDQRALYHDVLVDAGYKVLDAPTAKLALELFEREKPDLVVLDIQMPEMDGIDALSRILAQRRDTPVILYSAYPHFKQNFLTWPADAFVEKTGHPQELVEAVRKVSKQKGISIPEPVCDTTEV